MWVMSSKRFPGSSGSPPYVEFRIGAIPVAQIIMRAKLHSPWEYHLYLMRTEEGPTGSLHASFSDALRALHSLLKSPSPEGFKTSRPKRAAPSPATTQGD